MAFYTEAIKQGGPDREALVEAWNKSKVNGRDVGQIFSKKHPESRFIVIIEGSTLELPVVQKGNNDLVSLIGGENLNFANTKDAENVLANLNLKEGKNSKFLGPRVDCSVSQIDGGAISKIVINNFVLDRINLAKQFEWFDLTLTPCDSATIERLSQ